MGSKQRGWVLKSIALHLREIFLRRSARTVHALQKNLETVLEKDVWLDHQNPVPEFVAMTDVSHLEDTLEFLPVSSVEDRVVHLFSRLAPYFTSGVLLYKQDEKMDNDSGPLKKVMEIWRPQAIFNKGQFYASMVSQGKPYEPVFLKLPFFPLLELRRTSPHTMLRQLHLQEFFDSPDSSAFAFKATEYFGFLVFSELPEPWLRTHIQNVFKIVAEALGAE